MQYLSNFLQSNLLWLSALLKGTSVITKGTSVMTMIRTNTLLLTTSELSFGELDHLVVVSLQEASIIMLMFFTIFSYLTYIRTIVGENLQRAQVGGIPGTYHLVQGFLKVKLLHPIPGLEVRMYFS